MKILISIITLFVFSTGFLVSDKMEAKIKKEVLSVYQIDSYDTESVLISAEINTTLPVQITGDNFFKILNNEELLGYYFLGKAYGKADYFDFMVIFDKDLIISKATVLVYREDHGGEVGSKRWLKQFNGTKTNQVLKYQEDIVGISGATISVKSMTNEINKLLKTVHILQTKNQL